MNVVMSILLLSLTGRTRAGDDMPNMEEENQLWETLKPHKSLIMLGLWGTLAALCMVLLFCRYVAKNKRRKRRKGGRYSFVSIYSETEAEQGAVLSEEEVFAGGEDEVDQLSVIN